MLRDVTCKSLSYVTYLSFEFFCSSLQGRLTHKHTVTETHNCTQRPTRKNTHTHKHAQIHMLYKNKHTHPHIILHLNYKSLTSPAYFHPLFPFLAHTPTQSSWLMPPWLLQSYWTQWHWLVNIHIAPVLLIRLTRLPQGSALSPLVTLAPPLAAPELGCSARALAMLMKGPSPTMVQVNGASSG